MLSSGKGFDNYGLILCAATLVPLQGCWNNFVYIRPRYLSKILSSSGQCVLTLFQGNSKEDATDHALKSLQQAGACDQLQAVSLYGNAINSTSYKEGDDPNTREKDLGCKTTKRTLNDNLARTLDEVPEGGLKNFSHFWGNESFDAQENFEIEEPLRVSTNNNSVFNQDRSSSAGSKDIDEGAVYDKTSN